MINGSILQEDITSINIYATNSRASKSITQTLTELEGEVHSNKRIVGDFNISLSIMDRTTRQKINKQNL